MEQAELKALIREVTREVVREVLAEVLAEQKLSSAELTRSTSGVVTIALKQYERAAQDAFDQIAPLFERACARYPYVKK